jgi:hypothetical protein
MNPRLAALAAFAFALAGLACAQAPETAADDADLAMPAMPMAPMGPPAGVRKISDAGLSCQQIHTEARSLEEAIVKHRAASEAAQRDANAAQENMMKRASSAGAAPMASSLLSMVPGAGMFGGLAAQAAMSAQQSAIQEGTSQVMAAYQRVTAAQEQLAYAEARNDHLVGLFLDRKCRLPEGAARPAVSAQ